MNIFFKITSCAILFSCTKNLFIMFTCLMLTSPLSPNEQKHELQNRMKMSRNKIILEEQHQTTSKKNCKKNFYFFSCHPFLCLMKFNYSTLCIYRKTLNGEDGTTNGILLCKVNMHGGNYSFAIVATLKFILSCLFFVVVSICSAGGS